MVTGGFLKIYGLLLVFWLLCIFSFDMKRTEAKMFMASIGKGNKRRLSSAAPRGWRRKLPLVKIA